MAVAFLAGTIELISFLHDNAGWVNPITTWISGIDLNNVGFIVVGLFIATWAVALTYWRLARVEDRGHPCPPQSRSHPDRCASLAWVRTPMEASRRRSCPPNCPTLRPPTCPDADRTQRAVTFPQLADLRSGSRRGKRSC